LWWRMSNQLLCNWKIVAINRLYFSAHRMEGTEGFDAKTTK
jgi:hypothetical protein